MYYYYYYYYYAVHKILYYMEMRSSMRRFCRYRNVVYGDMAGIRNRRRHYQADGVRAIIFTRSYWTIITYIISAWLVGLPFRWLSMTG